MAYGESTSGEHGHRGGYVPSGRRVSGRNDGFGRERYSKANTVTSDPHEPGRSGQDDFIYDDPIILGPRSNTVLLMVGLLTPAP